MKRKILGLFLLIPLISSCNNIETKEKTDFNFNYEHPTCFVNDVLKLEISTKEEVKWDVEDSCNSYINQDGLFYGLTSGDYIVNATTKTNKKSIKIHVADFNNLKKSDLNIDSFYYKDKVENNLCELYYKKDLDKSDKTKVLLFIHGGGWIAGDNSEYDSYSIGFANEGYVVANMNYSLIDLPRDLNDFKLSKVCVSTMLDEIDLCILKTKERLKELGFDDNKLELAIQGDSAGAHLASLYAYTRKESKIPLKFLFLTVCPIYFDPYLWTSTPSNLLYTAKNYSNEVVSLLLGEDIRYKEYESDSIKLKEIMNRLSPIADNRNYIPTIAWFGFKDNITNGFQQYKYFENEFNNKKIDHISIVSPTGWHLVRDENSDEKLNEFYKAFIKYSNLYF